MDSEAARRKLASALNLDCTDQRWTLERCVEAICDRLNEWEDAAKIPTQDNSQDRVCQLQTILAAEKKFEQALWEKYQLLEQRCEELQQRQKAANRELEAARQQDRDRGKVYECVLELEEPPPRYILALRDLDLYAVVEKRGE